MKVSNKEAKIFRDIAIIVIYIIINYFRLELIATRAVKQILELFYSLY